MEGIEAAPFSTYRYNRRTLPGLVIRFTTVQTH